MFLDENMFRKWWDVHCLLIEKQAGGIYSPAWGITAKGFGFVLTGIAERYEPNGLLEIAQLV